MEERIISQTPKKDEEIAEKKRKELNLSVLLLDFLISKM
jgi:hypothetical protein